MMRANKISSEIPKPLHKCPLCGCAMIDAYIDIVSEPYSCCETKCLPVFLKSRRVFAIEYLCGCNAVLRTKYSGKED